MLDRIAALLEQWGPHEAQIALTVTLLAATAILALLCDVIRYRTSRTRTTGIAVRAQGPVSEAAPALRTTIAKTLVPELPAASAEKKALARASRLATALKQPRRVLSPAAQAVIQRSAQAAQTSPARVLPTGLQDGETL